MTLLSETIERAPLVDTHEHLQREADYLSREFDILVDLFDNYVTADLVVAGASQEAVKRLVDASGPDIPARFAGVQEAWGRCQHTGYGEAVRLIAQHAYGMEHITASALEASRDKASAMRRPGARLRTLKDLANLDHCQIDCFDWVTKPDEAAPEFFLYDLSWLAFCSGTFTTEGIHKAVGIEVTDVDSLDGAMVAFFERSGPLAVAVKAQHAYNRTLRWEERSRSDVERALKKVLGGRDVSEEERNCLGDWCWARGIELAIEHDLPFKIHTGYYAGHSRMPVDRIRAGNLCALLTRYPKARFVLMHIAYPYSDELVALAKHYPNVYVDLCWAWSIDPYSACDFVRRMIHAVPSNKLLAFGGDTFWPNAALAYSIQARRWLTRALQAEIDDGLLPEKQAIDLAARLMRENQYACFDIEGTRAAIRERLAVSA